MSIISISHLVICLETSGLEKKSPCRLVAIKFSKTGLKVAHE